MGEVLRTSERACTVRDYLGWKHHEAPCFDWVTHWKLLISFLERDQQTHQFFTQHSSRIQRYLKQSNGPPQQKLIFIPGAWSPREFPPPPPPPPGWDAICSPSQLCSLQYTTSKHKIKDPCGDGNKKIAFWLRKSSDRKERAQISPTLIQSLQPCQALKIHISTTSLQFCSWISQKERDCCQISQVRWPVCCFSLAWLGAFKQVWVWYDHADEITSIDSFAILAVTNS